MGDIFIEGWYLRAIPIVIGFVLFKWSPWIAVLNAIPWIYLWYSDYQTYQALGLVGQQGGCRRFPNLFNQTTNPGAA